MKSYFKRFFIFTAVVFSFQFSCEKQEDIYTASKRALLQHNYLIVNTTDGTPAEVEVSYSVYVTGNSGNVVKTERKTTPFVIGGEQVMAQYDSIYALDGSESWHLHNELKSDYQPQGSDYLVIKNTSTATVEYCVVGNQKMRYCSLKELNSKPHITNKEAVDVKKILKEYPLPI